MRGTYITYSVCVRGGRWGQVGTRLGPHKAHQTSSTTKRPHRQAVPYAQQIMSSTKHLRLLLKHVGNHGLRRRACTIALAQKRRCANCEQLEPLLAWPRPSWRNVRHTNLQHGLYVRSKRILLHLEPLRPRAGGILARHVVRADMRLKWYSTPI